MMIMGMIIIIMKKGIKCGGKVKHRALGAQERHLTQPKDVRGGSS